MFHVPNEFRMTKGAFATTEEYGNNGAFIIPYENVNLRCIASDGEGWEHVSVSLTNRCPSWQEMSFVKNQFWSEEDCVIEYHPPKTKYINKHPFCLHLWRKANTNFELPPSYLVG